MVAVPRYGGLVTVLQKLKRSYLIEKGCFNQHKTFVLGEALVAEETERVTVAISTENLLLNAYRCLTHTLTLTLTRRVRA